jgi:hypothetical protein
MAAGGTVLLFFVVLFLKEPARLNGRGTEPVVAPISPSSVS